MTLGHGCPVFETGRHVEQTMTENSRPIDSPGSVVHHIAEIANASNSRGHRKYWGSFQWFYWYCITPPVYPDARCAPNRRMLYGGVIPVPRMCIVCEKVHITSETCGREKPESRGRDSTVRRDDGYKLQQARNMGMFDDI